MTELLTDGRKRIDKILGTTDYVVDDCTNEECVWVWLKDKPVTCQGLIGIMTRHRYASQMSADNQDIAADCDELYTLVEEPRYAVKVDGRIVRTINETEYNQWKGTAWQVTK